MEILAVLSNPILPVFAIMAGGFLAGRWAWVRVDEARTINRFAMTVLLPIFVFRLIANAPIEEFPLVQVLLYGGVELVVFSAAFVLARYFFVRDAAESVLLAFCCIFVNNALYGLPIAILLYGEGGVLPLTAVVTLDSVITFAGAMVALQWIGLGGAKPWAIAASLARTPLILGHRCGAIGGVGTRPVAGAARHLCHFQRSGGRSCGIVCIGRRAFADPFPVGPGCGEFLCDQTLGLRRRTLGRICGGRAGRHSALGGQQAIPARRRWACRGDGVLIGIAP